MVNTRELILEILLEVIEKGSYSHLIIRNVLDKYQYLEKQERAFITRVAEGTIQTMIELDYIINQYSKVKVNNVPSIYSLYPPIYSIFLVAGDITAIDGYKL